MMLYKMAKWMEERAALDNSIRESQGDVRFLQHRKEQVEEAMLVHAQHWFGADNQTFRETDIPGLYVVEPVEAAPWSNVL